MKETTLSLLFKGGEILLAMKKRGFGAGRWNDAGGKFDAQKGDKNIFDAVMRETKEEIGVSLIGPERVGVLRFRFQCNPEWDQNAHVFLAKKWAGVPKESEEMAPKWFKFQDIPYKNMWPDDIHWMPHILQGEKMEADFLFGEGDKILDYSIKVVEEI